MGCCCAVVVEPVEVVRAEAAVEMVLGVGAVVGALAMSVVGAVDVAEWRSGDC